MSTSSATAISEAAADSSIKLARYAPETELSIALLVAQSMLVGSSPREALDDTTQWAQTLGVALMRKLDGSRRKGLRLPRGLPSGRFVGGSRPAAPHPNLPKSANPPRRVCLFAA
ncbi:MAG TPA: hypothetical protein VF665_18995 [Longimicrobium sp.]|jgi:hypothetical protein|uniref:hypothetical protein n=1 Tax=Longimicrobium sp. TaxID=2029185 RepID=UPI002EDA7DF9